MEYRVIISGFGGQGILFAGKVLAQAALNDGFYVSWLPSYGPEMRGGTCNCRLVISDDEISSPSFAQTDALIALNVPSVEKFSADTGKLIITDNRYTGHCNTKAKVISTDMTGCDNALLSMAMLGKFIEATGIVCSDSVISAVKAFSGTRAEQNLKAMGL